MLSLAAHKSLSILGSHFTTSKPSVPEVTYIGDATKKYQEIIDFKPQIKVHKINNIRLLN